MAYLSGPGCNLQFICSASGFCAWKKYGTHTARKRVRGCVAADGAYRGWGYSHYRQKKCLFRKFDKKSDCFGRTACVSQRESGVCR